MLRTMLRHFIPAPEQPNTDPQDTRLTSQHHQSAGETSTERNSSSVQTRHLGLRLRRVCFWLQRWWLYSWRYAAQRSTWFRWRVVVVVCDETATMQGQGSCRVTQNTGRERFWAWHQMVGFAVQKCGEGTPVISHKADWVLAWYD